MLDEKGAPKAPEVRLRMLRHHALRWRRLDPSGGVSTGHEQRPHSTYEREATRGRGEGERRASLLARGATEHFV